MGDFADGFVFGPTVEPAGALIPQRYLVLDVADTIVVEIELARMLDDLPIAPVELLHRVSQPLFMAFSFGNLLGHGRFGAGSLHRGPGALRQLFAQRDFPRRPAPRLLLKNMQGRLQLALFYERDRYVRPSMDRAIKREERLVARIGFRIVDHAGLAARELIESNHTERLQRKPAGTIGQLLCVPHS